MTEYQTDILEPTESAVGFFNGLVDLMPSNLPTQLISEHAQQNRIMPPGTPRPGPLDLSYTPFLIEPMDNMSPMSPIQHTGVMKGAQLGFTMLLECIICYYMGYSPADIMLISATEGMLERWASRRLEPAINSYGLREYIFSQYTAENKKTRKSGDKTYSKEYFGCRLDLASAQSAPSLRSTDKRVLLRDEVDGAPAQLKTGEGSWLDVSYARTNSWGDRRKVADISTPTTYELSAVFPLYESGDQRKFMVRCPLCEKEQELVFGNEKSQYGLKPITEGGVLVSAYYMCDHCHDAIMESSKPDLLGSGVWHPTAKSDDRFKRTYHISSLYAPLGMISWRELYRLFLKSEDDPIARRSFTNLYLGLPFKEDGTKPKLEKVIELIGGYQSGTVPDGVLYLVASIDVQRGSQRDERNPARLEMEVMGIGAGYRTWSITYRRFEGPVDDPFEGAWEDLNEFTLDGGLVFTRRDGSEFSPRLMFIDSGDGENTETVCRFCERWRNTYPSKGFQQLKPRKGETGGVYDEKGRRDFMRYRLAKLKFGNTYEISTNYYKTNIYNFLNIKRQPTDPQRAGFCDFPRDYGERYFKMLTAEEKLKDGSFYCPSGARNEALDCRVMNMCAADVYLDILVEADRERAKKAGWSAQEIKQITRRTIIDKLEYANKAMAKRGT